MESWRRLPEIHVLAEIAAELGVRFALRGSVVRVLLAELDSQRSREASLFDFVPALSDVDVVTPTATDGERVRSAIYAHLPFARFFHWDVRDEVSLVRYQERAFVRVTPEPRLYFAPREKPAPIEHHPVFSIGTDGRLAMVPDQPGVASKDEARWDLPATALPIERAMLLLPDVLYVARRCPEQIGKLPPDAVSRHLALRPRDQVAWIAAHPRFRQRLIRSALKLVYGPPPASALPEWLIELLRALSVAADDRVLETVLRAASSPGREPTLLTIVRPEERGGRWVPLVHEVRESTLEPAVASVVGIVAAAAGLVGSPTPVFSLRVERPERPGCCRYQDWARGIAEFVWSSPEQPSGPVGAHFAMLDVSRPQLDQTRANAPDHAVDAPAWVAIRQGVGSIRADYNFLCTVAARRSTVRVLGWLASERGDG